MARMYRVTITRTTPDRSGHWSLERWPMECTCSWTLVAIARDAGARLAEQHMREQHHGQGHAWLDKRRRVEIYGLDERVLSKAERATYTALASAASHRWAGRAITGNDVWKIAAIQWLLAFCVAVLGILLALIGSGAPDSTLDSFALYVLALLPVVTALVCSVVPGQIRTVVRKRVTDYLRSIGFTERTRASPTASQSSGPATARSDQHQWYGDNSRLDWRHRVQAETFGLDADTYRSNMLEHDKD